jgi:hypothetical protein
MPNYSRKPMVADRPQNMNISELYNQYSTIKQRLPSKQVYMPKSKEQIMSQIRS